MSMQVMNRREVLRLTAAAGLWSISARSFAWQAAPHAAPGMDGAEAMQSLKDGNLRFSSGKPTRDHQDMSRIKQVAGGQHPFATILGCSDSRVPPEIIFDQGLGDLFTVRVAGNVVSREVAGSVEYAALHLHTKAFLVLAHEDCGAVKAALSSPKEQSAEPPAIRALLGPIDSALRDTQLPASGPERVTRAAEANARHSAAQLKEALNGQKGGEDLVVQAAVYQVSSGKVRWL
jgi:carbonic anhydrase